MNVEIRPAQLSDAPLLAANMRQADIAEVNACGRDDLHAAVTRCVQSSHLCWAAFVDGELACIFGVAPLSVLTGIGSPWMLGTPVLERAQRVLVRLTPRYIARMLTAFPHLVNHVHAENTTSVRWLRRLGFKLQPAQPYGPRGALFHPFTLDA